MCQIIYTVLISFVFWDRKYFYSNSSNISNFKCFLMGGHICTIYIYSYQILDFFNIKVLEYLNWKGFRQILSQMLLIEVVAIVLESIEVFDKHRSMSNYHFHTLPRHFILHKLYYLLENLLTKPNTFKSFCVFHQIFRSYISYLYIQPTFIY